MLGRKLERNMEAEISDILRTYIESAKKILPLLQSGQLSPVYTEQELRADIARWEAELTRYERCKA